jgi:hypothetical protein
MENQTVTLTVKLTDAIIGYLAKRPYEETAGLIHAIQQEAREAMQVPVQAKPPEENRE